jgi:hypothetical protein
MTKIWKTDRCELCGNSHKEYMGLLDVNGIEYVVCENTGKRINIKTHRKGKISVMPTKWKEDIKDDVNIPSEKKTLKSLKCNNCDDFKPEMAKINSFIILGFTHGFTFDGKIVEYCPWCGGKLSYEEIVI